MSWVSASRALYPQVDGRASTSPHPKMSRQRYGDSWTRLGTGATTPSPTSEVLAAKVLAAFPDPHERALRWGSGKNPDPSAPALATLCRLTEAELAEVREAQGSMRQMAPLIERIIAARQAPTVALDRETVAGTIDE